MNCAVARKVVYFAQTLRHGGDVIATHDTPSAQTATNRDAFWTTRTVRLIALLLVFRIVMLLVNPTGLHGDEAQYWAWSREPAFGYYSKPPGIAWVIAATTALFGHAEWAVRLGSPILHTGAAAFTALTARRIWGAKAGWLAAAGYALMPGVSLSASLISTDALLLFFVTLAVLAWVRVRNTRSWRDALLLGAAVGCGLLSKYAMMFLLPALISAVLLEPKTRAALLGWKGAATGTLAGLILLPNLVWNARNSFATLRHTGDNTNMSGGPSLNPGEVVEFIGGQFGVFGLLAFPLLGVALWHFRRERGLVFWLGVAVVAPLLIISVQALLSRANANWAAAAYGVAPLLLAGWAITSRKRMLWALAAIGINAIFAVVGPLVMMSPAAMDRMGLSAAVARLRGWPDTVERLRIAAIDAGAETIAVDNRLLFYDLLYYGMEDTAPLAMWRFEPRLNNHAELTQPLAIGATDVLLVSYYADYAPYFAADFRSVERIGEIQIPLGGAKPRRLTLYRADGYLGPRERTDR